MLSIGKCNLLSRSDSLLSSRICLQHRKARMLAAKSNFKCMNPLKDFWTIISNLLLTQDIQVFDNIMAKKLKFRTPNHQSTMLDYLTKPMTRDCSTGQLPCEGTPYCCPEKETCCEVLASPSGWGCCGYPSVRTNTTSGATCFLWSLICRLFVVMTRCTAVQRVWSATSTRTSTTSGAGSPKARTS